MTDRVTVTDAIPGKTVLLNRAAPVDSTVNSRSSQPPRDTTGQEAQVSVEAADYTARELAALMEGLNRALNVFDIEATYYVYDSTSLKVIQIRYAQDHELIRQVPTQEFLEHARTLHELIGLLFDEKA